MATDKSKSSRVGDPIQVPTPLITAESLKNMAAGMPVPPLTRDEKSVRP